MENRRQTTLARTLRRAAGCSKLVVIAVLFVPPLLAFQSRSQQGTVAAPTRIVKGVEVAVKPRSRELIKIYSIIKAHRPDVSEAETWRVAEVVWEECAKRKIDPLLVLALIKIESGFQYAAVSPVGARGIMQIMPDTARSLTHSVGGKYGIRPAAFRPEALDDPLLNIRLGVYYLHGLKTQFQDLNLTLSAYNFGPAELQNRLDNKLDYSSDFAALVLDAYQRYQQAKHPAF
jgi:soluble lytic murein transglycosylase-like protein